MAAHVTVLGFLMAFHKYYVWSHCYLLFTPAISLKSSNTIYMTHKPILITLSFTCRLLLTRIIIRQTQWLPWNPLYWTSVRGSWWMLTDKLKRDDGKTEFTLMRMKQQLSKVNIDSLTVGSIDVVDVTVARNLGLWFDSYLNLREQIHNTFFHLHNIQRIRKYLSQEFTRTLVDMLLS